MKKKIARSVATAVFLFLLLCIVHPFPGQRTGRIQVRRNRADVAAAPNQTGIGYDPYFVRRNSSVSPVLVITNPPSAP
jgi:hypothetical protein